MSSELRKRTPMTAEEKDALLNSLAASSPESIRPMAEKAVPVVKQAWEGVEKAQPVVMDLYAKLVAFWAALQPYHPNELLPAVAGLAMCFFGGEFPVLIATVVAVRTTGSWEQIKDSFTTLYSSASNVVIAVTAEDEAEETKETAPLGEANPKAAGKKELEVKLLTAIKTIDPEELASTVGTIATCFLAIIAALKLRFARILTLGTAIGNILTIPALRYGTPVIKKQIKDEEFFKWIDPVITYSCRGLAMSLAFIMMDLIAAIHSAVQGGQLFTCYLCRYLRKYGISAFDPDKSNLDEMAGYGLAAVGLFWQLVYGPPVLLRLVMLPITITESVLETVLALAS